MPACNTTIRAEREEPTERAAVHAVNTAAFGRADEADLVDSLRAEGAVLASLVAEVDSYIAGHILFSRMIIETPDGPVPAAALAPMAVLPEYQNRGIGGLLIQQGLQSLRESGERIVIVLGHPHYYSRFGFTCEAACAFESPFPPEAYMSLELTPGAVAGIHGKVKYAASFGLSGDNLRPCHSTLETGRCA